MTDPAPTGQSRTVDTLSHDRWLYAWATGYDAVGGALASTAGPLAAFGVPAAVTILGTLVGVYSARTNGLTS